MFSELRCKTYFSFLQGASSPEDLVQRAFEIGLPALAITDVNGVYGVPKAYWRAKDLPGFKLIVGAEIRLVGHSPLTVLARDRAAYGWMCQVLTQAHADKDKGRACLTLEELRPHLLDTRSQGIIGLVDADADYEELKPAFEKRLFTWLTRYQDGHDRERTQKAIQMSERWDAPLVASNDVHYHIPGRRRLHDVFSCVREGVALDKAGYKLAPNAERYLKSTFEMRLLFKDLPRALTQAYELGESCQFSPSELRYRYPSEWIPVAHSAQSFLEEETWRGAKERYSGVVPDDVARQLRHELALIKQMHFADYFLTIYDIVQFARSRDILCQGRGSAANSAVCYCLGITAIDPVRTQLLFERFISIERNEPPDIDVDFEHERREEVIQYIYEKYGRHRAAMVSAVITYQRRSAFREVSKAFGVPVGTRSAKKLLAEFENLQSHTSIPASRSQIEELAKEMDGFPRHLSIHCGGFTLSADPITEIVPIEPARMPGRSIIQWDKYDLDYLGLLKVDVLSLGMLSALRRCLDMVGLKLHEIPAEDPDTYRMIQKADTVGTFQVESRAQMNMSGRLRPCTFYDLVVQVAIVRPGPIVGKMVHPYLKRRRGEERVDYPHPKLREILGRTLGVPLFQEQLMRIAIELGEFTPGEADTLRRAIGAWRASGSIQKVAARLLEGLRRNGIPGHYADLILEHMKGFAHYGFPESHAASFALLTYASCYLKCHHPAEFVCSLINSQPMGFYAIHSLVDDAKLHGVSVLPVDPQKSNWDCCLEEGELRIGLRVVNGLSRREAEEIIEQRPFASLEDFLARVSLRTDVLYRMAMAGAFRGFGEDSRHTLWRLLSHQVKKAGTGKQQQFDLFTGVSTVSSVREQNLFARPTDFEKIKADYEAYNLSTQAHPMQVLRQDGFLPKVTTFAAKRKPPKTRVTTSGLLLVRQKPPTAGGVCFAAIEDEYGFLDLVIFRREYEKYRETFLNQCFLIVSGWIERDGHSVSLIVTSLAPVWKEERPLTVDLNIEPTQYFWSY